MKKYSKKNIGEIKEYFSKLYGEENDTQNERYTELLEKFCKTFDENEAFFASSPGRVEVCGNHTDHNGGKVVACSISLDTLCAFLPTDDNIVKIKSEGYDAIIVDLNGEPKEKQGTSAALVRGVCVGLKNKGYNVGGFNACVTSNVIGGAGISSSASFEVLIAEIENALYNDGKVSCEEKSIVSQFAEKEFFGKPCGLLDQTAIAFGGLNELDFADTNKIGVQRVCDSIGDYTLVLVNTCGSHENLTDEYASIPYEMFSVANALGKKRLIEVNEEEFYDKINKLEVSDRACNRAVHFYNENKRVERLANALKTKDYKEFLAVIKESGISSLCMLQNCYVGGSKIQPIPKALAICSKYNKDGANRVHGGGFAGTILNIVKDDNLCSYVKNLQKHYSAKDIIPLKVRSLGTIVL